MGKWTFEFEAPLNGRVHRYGRAVTTLFTESESLWWAWEEKRWVTDDERRASYETENGLQCSSHCSRVRTFKAFKRHLRKHTETLKGLTVLWVNDYEGHNVTAKYVE